MIHVEFAIAGGVALRAYVVQAFQQRLRHTKILQAMDMAVSQFAIAVGHARQEARSNNMAQRH